MYRDPSTKRDRYMALAAQLITDRSSFDAHWRDLGDHVLPTRTRFFTQDRNKGHKRNQKIIDATATFAASTLESGMHAGLTSPSRPWMLLGTPDPDLAKFGPVKEWLHTVTSRMLAIFQSTNLYQALPIVYGDMGTFATGAMAVLNDGVDLFRCYNYPIGSYALGVDARGLVTTFVHETEMSVRQVIEDYALIPGRTGAGSIDWSKVSRHVKDAWDRGRYEQPVDVCWIVLPNEDHDPKKLGSKYLRWSSCHYEKGTDERKFLRESGFKHFPIMAPRWRVSSHTDSYGIDCPGMRALGDIRQLQFMEKKKAQAIEKIVDPPVQAPNQLRTQKTSLLPGDVTYVDVSKGQEGIRTIHEVNLQLEHFSMDEDRVRARIQRHYYEDLFLMLATRDQSTESSQPLTAREVVERHEEKLLALGPVLTRANDELLEPLVDRVFDMMSDAGLIPDPPDELDGVDLRVEFISILSQAQKSVGVGAQDRFLQSTLGLAEVLPEVLDKIDAVEVVNSYADMLGIDPKIIRSDDEARARGEERQQQQAAVLKAQQAKDLAAAGKAASETDMTGDNALTRVIGGAAAANAANGLM